MEEKKLTCINCPMGCSLIVKMDGEKPVSISGNNCKYGDIYARREITNPVRILTSTVEVAGGQQKLVPVKSGEGIPRGKILECMDVLKTVRIQAPVHRGDVVVANIMDTGIDMIAVKDVEEKDVCRFCDR
ncbi:MAG: DUF1667 domain-containing protein [Roseburia sp.]|nr:DUF1667 domain-containing protein [Roseburia sp.]MCM1202082.1 DUF1667 domain-containing protein [Bacteroides fragilis]